MPKKEKEKKSSSTKDVNNEKKPLGGPKSIYVSLQKEYDEDKELIDLLSTKRNL